MPNAFTKIYIHLVFAVKNRRAMLPADKKDDLHRYMAGLLRQHDCMPIAINSVRDHVHLLLAYAPKAPLSDVIRDVKAFSSKMINEHSWTEYSFYWQTGYGAFSVSPRQVDKVIGYIKSQEEHHRRRSFREEYLEFLQAAGIEYDPAYLFEWITDEAAPTARQEF